MVILVDTNIILDIFLKREPYKTNAEFILTKCANRQITGYLAAHSIPNLFYILRKDYTQQERRKLIKNLCSIFRISDFEHCLQEECAVNIMADYIVTRNPGDFVKSRVKVMKPEEFTALL